MVIKNGVNHFPKRKNIQTREPIKIIHHCTPWRGLNVLLLAMQYVQNKNVTLDVYSSNQIYGNEFAQKNDKDTRPLFDQAKKLPM